MSQSTSTPFLFGKDCLETLAHSARTSPRMRKNLDLHGGAADPAQRLLNAVEPESYVRPHRHLEPFKDETLIALRGAFGLIFFDEAGGVSSTAVIAADGEYEGVNIPRGVFHTLVSLRRGSVFFEAKGGPYDPALDKDVPAWAPAEGSPEASDYHATLKALFQSA